MYMKSIVIAKAHHLRHASKQVGEQVPLVYYAWRYNGTAKEVLHG